MKHREGKKKEQLSNGVQNESKYRDRGQAESGVEECKGEILEEKLTLLLLHCVIL